MQSFSLYLGPHTFRGLSTTPQKEPMYLLKFPIGGLFVLFTGSYIMFDNCIQCLISMTVLSYINIKHGCAFSLALGEAR